MKQQERVLQAGQEEPHLEGCTMKECVSGEWKAGWLWISELLNKMAQQHEMKTHFQYYVNPREKCPKEMQLNIFFNLTILH